MTSVTVVVIVVVVGVVSILLKGNIVGRLHIILGDIRLDETGFGFGECIRMRACTCVHNKLSCTRLQNYTIGASLLGIRIRIPKSNIPLVLLFYFHERLTSAF